MSAVSDVPCVVGPIWFVPASFLAISILSWLWPGGPRAVAPAFFTAFQKHPRFSHVYIISRTRTCSKY